MDTIRILFPCAAVALVATAASQSHYVNYEDPVGKPIAVANITGFPFPCVLVCNTPDDRVEVYRATIPLGAPLVRVPVGPSPVTVRWHEGRQALFTCNSLGDSVTMATLFATSPTEVVGVVNRTMPVGDEPTDLVFPSHGGAFDRCFVTLGRGDVVELSLPLLQPIASHSLQVAPPAPGVVFTDAVKTARAAVLLPPADRLVVLNGQGGNGGSPQGFQHDDYDLDLYVNADPFAPNAFDPSSSTLPLRTAGLGTTHFAMAANAAGTRLYVVGQSAQNRDAAALDEAGVRALPTGFTQSWLWTLDTGNPAVAPVLNPEASGQLPAAVQPSLDLNRNYTNGTERLPVAKSLALAQPTDVALIEENGEVLAVVVAAFGSDRVAVLTPDQTKRRGWAVTRIGIPLTNPNGVYGRSGPRGLAWSPATVDPTAPAGTAPGVVFVANRLDNSIAAVNPWTGVVVGQRALVNDPTPDLVRIGREFLYSADLSRSGFVSCASCHIDGRTDGLGWRLSDGHAAPYPPELLDRTAPSFVPEFPADKGVMVTQTLQGLVNSHVEELEMQDFFSNRPYHWRGDRATFEDFNRAFVGLLGLPSLVSTEPPKGITDAAMTAFRRFVDSIHHPPNPEQEPHRGDLTTAGAVADDGMEKGMQLYHELALSGPCDARSCVHCHKLPEGSGNTSTLDVNNQPLETAAIRNLFLREKARTPAPASAQSLANPWVRTGVFGLTHDGIATVNTSRSIDHFMFSFQASTTQLDRDRLAHFVRSFDTGTAPIVGLVRVLGVDPAGDGPALDLFEEQAREGNAGLAVRVHTGAIFQGYWFDVLAPVVNYRRDNQVALTRAQLLQLAAAGATVIVQATPPRGERRFASQSGVPAMLTGPAPTNVKLLPMVPNTLFDSVPSFLANVRPANMSPSLSIQAYLEDQLAPHALGIPTTPIHQPPRRFRVAGNDIRHGAKLVLGMKRDLSGNTRRSGAFDLVPVRLGGQVYWESMEELDPLQQLVWLAGGPDAAGVGQVLANQIPGPVLDPAQWNDYLVTIVNEDGSSSVPFKEQLRVANVR